MNEALSFEAKPAGQCSLINQSCLISEVIVRGVYWDNIGRFCSDDYHCPGIEEFAAIFSAFYARVQGKILGAKADAHYPGGGAGDIEGMDKSPGSLNPWNELDITGSNSPFSFQTLNDCCYLLNITPCGGLGLIDAVDIGGYHSLQVLLSQAAGE